MTASLPPSERYRVGTGPTSTTDRLAEIKAHLARVVQHGALSRDQLKSDEYLGEVIADLDRLRAHLRTLEWVSVPGPVPDARCCPVPECGVAKGGRHAPTCWLAEAIGAERDAGN